MGTGKSRPSIIVLDSPNRENTARIFQLNHHYECVSRMKMTLSSAEKEERKSRTIAVFDEAAKTGV